MKVLPVPTPVQDSQGRQWAGYTLDQAKQLMVLDDELYSLRLQGGIWQEARRGYKGQVSLLKQLLTKEQEKYALLDARFLEKSRTLDLTIEEKNQLKYQRRWALFGGRSSFLASLALVGIGVAVSR